MSKQISIPIPSDLQFAPKQFLEDWETGGFIESQNCLDIWDDVQKTLKESSRVGLYLAGPMGIGKSSIMFYVVHKSHQLGWFVVYIPRCDDWLGRGKPFSSGWYSYFFDAVLAGLEFVSPEIKAKYAYCIPPNNHTSWSKAVIVEELSEEHFQQLFLRFVFHFSRQRSENDE